jgi:hypothetical protein
LQFVNLSGTEIKRLITLLVIAALISPAASGATQSPTPKVTATKKATPTKKPVVKKKVVVKKKPTAKKKSKLSPSPSPKWPPAGFKSNGEVYAKIPTAKELVGTASSSAVLARQLAQLVDGVRICEKYSCGALQIASLNGCTWWEINAKLVGRASADDKTLVTFGNIRTLVRESAPRVITTVLLISQEPLELGRVVTGISANCHHDATSEKIPSSTYSAINN